MASVTCPGLPASWVNAWLAAVGVTVLDSRMRLSWTNQSTPVAFLAAEGADPVEVVVASWPSVAEVADLPIAERWRDAAALKRNGRRVTVDAFGARAEAARRHPHSWTLSSTMTDLCIDDHGEVAHGPFDPSGPGTVKWLHHRLLRAHRSVEAARDRIADTLAGHALRVRNNGLGFDIGRLGSMADDAVGIWTDPVIEVLAFFGLAVLPMRGAGSDRRQRGWLSARRLGGKSGERRFMWPAWRRPLDRAGVDALLDLWQPHRRANWERLDVHAAWQSVQFERRASADPTRAIGAVRL